MRLAQHVLTHRAQQHGRASAGRQDDELGVDLVRRLDDLPAGQAEDSADLPPVGLFTQHVAHRLAKIKAVPELPGLFDER